MLSVPLSSAQRFALLFSLFSVQASGRPAPPAAAPPLLRVQPVAPQVFVPMSRPVAAGPVSNGLLIQSPKGLLLVDAAWNAAQTEQLLRWAADSLHQRVRVLVLTHAHAATPEALDVLRRHRVRLYSSAAVARRWHTLHPKAVALIPALKPYTLIRAGRTRLELFFPGPGRGTDQGVAWLPRQKVLFGGEVVQVPATGTPAVGRSAWAASLRTVAARYPRARVVVPARGPMGTWALLTTGQRLPATPAVR